MRESVAHPLDLQIMTEVLRAVYRFTNVRRAPGQSGELPRYAPDALTCSMNTYLLFLRFKVDSHPDLRYAYLDQNQSISAWPIGLTVEVRFP